MNDGRETILVVGAGNELLGDEGLGVHVARWLLAAGSLPANVAVLEAGTCLLDAVPEMSRHSHVILVDAVCIGGEPGTVYRMELPADLDDQLRGSRPVSLHEWGVFETLQAARALGLLPGRLTLFGAEPESIQPGTELSPVLARAARQIVSTLLTELGIGPTAGRNLTRL